MSDSLVFEKSNELADKDDVPFLKKEMVYIDDQNQRNYSSNQVTIETTTLSNNGRYLDYHQGYLTIPLVVTVAGLTAAGDVVDFTTDAAIQTDLLLCLKNLI
jgi:hypothetical protein